MTKETPKTLKTIDDLRQKNDAGVTILREMVEAEKYDEILSLAKRDIKGHLTYDDVMTPDADGVNILMVAGWQGKLDTLFETALWKNGHRELTEVVKHLPRTFAKDIDGPAAVQNVIQNQFKYKERMTIKRRHPKP